MRAGTRAVLAEAGFVVAAEVDSPEGAVRVAARHRPELVVLDLRLGGGSGMGVLGGLAADCPVLVHSMHVELAGAALRRGAAGFVSKNAPAEVLRSAAVTVAGGGRYLEPGLAAELAAPQDGPLTPRERQVLELLADGHTNREAAGLLSVSVRTVESVRAGLRTRLGLVTRAELVAYLRRRGGGPV